MNISFDIRDVAEPCMQPLAGYTVRNAVRTVRMRVQLHSLAWPVRFAVWWSVYRAICPTA